MTERLKTALAAGGVVELFSLLHDWSVEDLNALVKDCGAYYEEACAAIEEARRKAIFTPQVFFSNRAEDAVNRAADDGQLKALAVTSEICSVAFYYLEEAGQPSGNSGELGVEE
jgi:hypothetical protein